VFLYIFVCSLRFLFDKSCKMFNYKFLMYCGRWYSCYLCQSVRYSELEQLSYKLIGISLLSICWQHCRYWLDNVHIKKACYTCCYYWVLYNTLTRHVTFTICTSNWFLLVMITNSFLLCPVRLGFTIDSQCPKDLHVLEKASNE